MSDKQSDTTVLSFTFDNVPYLEKELGKKQAAAFFKSCISYLKTIVQDHNGVVIQDNTNGLMSTFEIAANAVEAGKTIHQDLKCINVNENSAIDPPAACIGLHFGKINKTEENVEGDAINVVNQLTNAAKQGQIITSEQTLEHLSPDIRSLTQSVENTTVESDGTALNLYDIIWDLDDLSELSYSDEDNVNDKELQSFLELQMEDKLIEVDQNRSAITIGRQSQNDLIIREKPVSRLHARVEYRTGTFFIVDQSFNGTFVLIEGQKPKHITKDELQLTGNGLIGVGKKADPNQSGMIHFKLKFRTS